MNDTRTLANLPAGGAAGAAELVISAYSVVSPFGTGTEAFGAGIAAGRSSVAALDPAEWPALSMSACLVPGFGVREALGSKGTRSLDRATGLAVVAVGRLLDEVPAIGPGPYDDVGLVLGTNNGSVDSVMAFTRDSLTQAKPYHVDPARFPSTVMNFAAGQCAIWHGLRGPNATVAGGHVSGLLALSYATRLVRCGHIESVITGAVEEFSVQRSWLERHARSDEGAAWTPGEGCAVFLLEPVGRAIGVGRRPLATVLALELGYQYDGDAAEVLAGCIRRSLERSGLAAADVSLVASSGRQNGAGGVEAAAMRRVCGHRPNEVASASLYGDLGAAASAFQVAGVLAVGDGRDASGQVALVTSSDRDGVLGCALLRRW